jgi:hypothetical protein
MSISETTVADATGATVNGSIGARFVGSIATPKGAASG